MNHKRSKRRRRMGKPMALGDVLNAKSKRWRFVHLAKLELINSKWEQAAGAYVAQHVRPARLVRKQLRLAVDDSSWISEMTYLAPTILEKLKKLLPGPWVEELKAVAGEPMPAPNTTSEHKNTSADLPRSPVTKQMMDQANRIAMQVQDPVLAEAIRKATISRLRRNMELTKTDSKR